jgi:Leucine-rich repeat (LRR) protein
MDGPLRVVDDALVTRVLSLNPRCRKLNLSHNEISAVEGGAGASFGEDQAAAEAAASASGGRRVGLPAALRAPVGSPFARLPNLVYLNLSYNHLTELGPAFGALTALGTLDVSHNRL